MTLDDAIEHAKEAARTCDDKACAAEHAQLAEWLSLLKVYTDTHMAEEVQRARHEMHGWQLEWKREMNRRKELEAENDRLRELCKELYGFAWFEAPTSTERNFAESMKELGIEVSE